MNDPLTEKIIACCFKVHSALGPGFNERVYHNALQIALRREGLGYKTEVEYPVSYESKKVGSLKLDLVVDSAVVVEVKAVMGTMPEIFKYQVLSYLHVSGLHAGLLVNFGNKSCHIRRYVR